MCFLRPPSSQEDEKNHILFRGKHSFVIMNIYPYNCAHLMVSPYRHIGCITKKNDSEKFEVNQLTNECIKILRAVSDPDGFNIGYNIGKAAGRGLRRTHSLPHCPALVRRHQFYASTWRG